MKTIRLFCINFLFALLLSACSLPNAVTAPAAPTATTCPPGADCSPASLTRTAAAVTPRPGDLGWGQVRGRVSDTIDGSPIAGASVTCTQRSNHPVSLCNATVKTSADGVFVFPRVFFQASDVIELSASHPAHGAQAMRQEFFTRPSLVVDFSLPVVDLTPHPCCTAPACRENEVYSCPGVCPCGCGTTCATRTPIPPGGPTPTRSISPTPPGTP